MAITRQNTGNITSVSFPSFDDIRNELKNQWKSIFGEIDLSPTSTDGHHLDLESKIIYGVYELAQWILSSINRNTAVGDYLDDLAFFVGIKRKQGENDESLRKRMDEAETKGMATFDGMITHLRNEIDPAVGISVNEESIPMNAMKPKSVAVFIPNGLEVNPDTVAQAIFNCKPAGIATNGNISGDAVDSAGNHHTIYYIIMDPKDIWIKVSLVKYDEEYLPADYVQRIRNSIVEWSKNEYKNGTDVIPDRLKVPVYSSVDGVKYVNVKVSYDGENWSEEPLSIESGRFATVESYHITVGIENG